MIFLIFHPLKKFTQFLKICSIIEPLLPSSFSFKKIYFLIWWQILPSSTNLVYIAEDKFICKQRFASFLPVSRWYLKLCPSEKVLTCSILILVKLFIKYGCVPKLVNKSVILWTLIWHMTVQQKLLLNC